MNAWYECGKVEDMNGNKLTKKDYFDWLGHLFNIDLSGYSNDLSNSMSSSVAYEKQSRIFDELKRKTRKYSTANSVFLPLQDECGKHVV